MGGKRLTEKEIASIQNEWLEGQSIIKLAKKFNRNRSTIGKTVLKPIRNKKDPDLIRRVNSINDNAFNELNEKTLFWIGFIFADGNIYYDKRSDIYAPRISISAHPRDEDIIHKFADFISFTGKFRRGINKFKEHKSPFVSISFVSKKIAKILEHYGVIPRKSKTLTPKNRISDYKHFWIGYICGDGSLGAYKVRKGKYTTFSPSIRIVGSLNMCYAFYDYCSKIVPESKAKPRKHKSIYNIGYSTRPAVKLMKHFFDLEEYGLTRKIKLAKQIIEEHSHRLNKSRPQTEKEKIEIQRLYNFNGWSIRKISRELKLDRNVISRALNESDIKIRKENQISIFDKKQEKEIIKLYKKFKSMPKTRISLNNKWKISANVSAYYRVLKRNNLETF